MKLSQFKHELRLNYKSDKWGEVMSAWFECCAHILHKGGSFPAHWGYRPGATNDPRDKENYYFSLFRKCSLIQLLTIGWFLCRLEGFLRKKGLSY